MALEESSSTWTEHFTALKERGLKTIGLILSATHKELIKAQEEEFPGTLPIKGVWSTGREISYLESRAKERKELARYIKQIYTSPNKKMAFDIAQLIANKYQDKHPRVANIKMIEDEDSDTDEDLIKDINKIKQEVNSKEELMAC